MLTGEDLEVKRDFLDGSEWVDLRDLGQIRYQIVEFREFGDRRPQGPISLFFKELLPELPACSELVHQLLNCLLYRPWLDVVTAQGVENELGIPG